MYAGRANDTIYGLAAGVWARDLSKAHTLAARLKSGTVWVNCFNVFDAALPFGGYKQSGWGREMGEPSSIITRRPRRSRSDFKRDPYLTDPSTSPL